jgi:glycerol uptake facilitator-like aquaporin
MAYSFNLNTFLGELFGSFLLLFMICWVHAYAHNKKDSKHLYLAVGYSAATLFAVGFGLAIQLVVQDLSSAKQLVTLNPSFSLVMALSNKFGSNAEWINFIVLFVAQILGGFLGASLGMLSTHFMYSRSEQIQTFKVEPMKFNIKFLSIQTMKTSIFLLSLFSILFISSKTASALSLLPLIIFVVVFLFRLVFGQRVETNENAMVSLTYVLASLTNFGSSSGSSVTGQIKRMTYMFFSAMLGAAISGVIFGLISSYSTATPSA